LFFATIAFCAFVGLAFAGKIYSPLCAKIFCVFFPFATLTAPPVSKGKKSPAIVPKVEPKPLCFLPPINLPISPPKVIQKIP